MGFRGTGSPKIITEHGATINLTHADIARDEPQNVITVSKSDVETDGARTIWNRGRHWEIEILDYMYKYNYPADQLQNLKNAYGTNVTFYLHDDGEPYKDADDNEVPFYFAMLRRELIGDPYDPLDALRMIFKSTVPVVKVGT